MQNAKDIRWKQRLEHFGNAMQHLANAIAIDQPDIFQRAGTIQFFEMNIELAWKLLKDYIEYQGFLEINSPRSVIKKGYELQLIQDGHAWLQALEGRNKASHTYDEPNMIDLHAQIKASYYPLLNTLLHQMKTLANEA